MELIAVVWIVALALLPLSGICLIFALIRWINSARVSGSVSGSLPAPTMKPKESFGLVYLYAVLVSLSALATPFFLLWDFSQEIPEATIDEVILVGLISTFVAAFVAVVTWRRKPFGRTVNIWGNYLLASINYLSSITDYYFDSFTFTVDSLGTLIAVIFNVFWGTYFWRSRKVKAYYRTS